MRATDPPPARHPRPQAWLLGMVSECWHAYVAVLARPDAAEGLTGLDLKNASAKATRLYPSPLPLYLRVTTPVPI